MICVAAVAHGLVRLIPLVAIFLRSKLLFTCCSDGRLPDRVVSIIAGSADHAVVDAALVADEVPIHDQHC
jgi:hypothetical protein